MNKFYLEQPSISRKKDALEFIQEVCESSSNICAVGGLEKCLSGKTYEEWIVEKEKRKKKEYAYSHNKVPGQTFFLIREKDNRLIGIINVRYNLTEEMLKFFGHISYNIRPNERKKGYNKVNLYFGLIEAKKLGLKKVMISCAVDNIGSDKTIKSLGGILERSEIDPSDGQLMNVYWLDVEKSIEENSEKFSSSVR